MISDLLRIECSLGASFVAGIPCRGAFGVIVRRELAGIFNFGQSQAQISGQLKANVIGLFRRGAAVSRICPPGEHLARGRSIGPSS